MSATNEKDIPVLTDIVEDEHDESGETAEQPALTLAAIPDLETVIAELQTRLASRTYALTDELMRSAFAELEASLFRQISSQLRQQLPELIDAVIREHLTRRDEPDGE